MSTENKEIYCVEIYALLPSDADPDWYLTTTKEFQNSIDLDKVNNWTVSNLYKNGEIKDAKLIFQAKYINPESLLSVGGVYASGIDGKTYLLVKLNSYERVAQFL